LIKQHMSTNRDRIYELGKQQFGDSQAQKPQYVKMWGCSQTVRRMWKMR